MKHPLLAIAMAILAFTIVLTSFPFSDGSPETTGSATESSESVGFGDEPTYGAFFDWIVYGEVGVPLSETYSTSGALIVLCTLDPPEGVTFTNDRSNHRLILEGTPTEACRIHGSIAITTSNGSSETHSISLYITTDTVSFDANADDATCSDDSITADNGTLILPSASRLGYHMTGWYTDPVNGTNVGMPGQQYSPQYNSVLYAHWEENGPVVIPDPEVSYNRDNGDTFRHQVEYELPYDEESTGATFTLMNGEILDDLITVNESTGLLSGSLLNVVPGTYTLIVQVHKTGYDDGLQYVNLTIDPYEYDEISEFLVCGQEFRHTFNMNPSDSYIDDVRIYVHGDVPYDGVDPVITNDLPLSLTFDEADTYWVFVDITSNGRDYCTQPYVFYVSENSSIPDEEPSLTDIQWSRNPTMDGGYFIWAVNPVYYDTITWSFGDGSQSVSGETSIIHQFDSQGHWSVTCTLENLNNGKTFTKTVYIDPILDGNTEVAYINVPYDFTFYDAPTTDLMFSTDPEQDWLDMEVYEADGNVYVRVYGTCTDGTLSGTSFTYTITGPGYNKTVTVSIQQDPETAEIGFTTTTSGFVVTVINQGDARGISRLQVDWNGDGNVDGRPADFSQFTHDYSVDFGAGVFDIILYVEYANVTIPVHLEVTVPSGSAVVSGSVVYHPNGGTGEMSSQSGDQVTIEDCAFTNGDKRFLAWCTAANGQGTVYMPGDIVYPTDGQNIDLYALWAADEEETDWLPIVVIIILAIVAAIVVARMILQQFPKVVDYRFRSSEVFAMNSAILDVFRCLLSAESCGFSL